MQQCETPDQAAAYWKAHIIPFLIFAARHYQVVTRRLAWASRGEAKQTDKNLVGFRPSAAL
jgi:hypothetical protein